MWLRRVSIMSVALLSLGGAVALANTNSLFSLPIAQNSMGSRQRLHSPLQLMKELNLSQEQQQKLQTIRSQYKDRISQRKQAVRKTTQELRSLMTSDASVNEIRTKHQQLQTSRQQLEEVSFESMLAMREVLTVEQRSRFAQLMEQRRENFRNQRRDQRGSEERGSEG